jgi:hypothetical protein
LRHCHCRRRLTGIVGRSVWVLRTLGSGGWRVVWALGMGMVGVGLDEGVERFGGGGSGHGGLGVAVIAEGLHCRSVERRSLILVRGKVRPEGMVVKLL